MPEEVLNHRSTRAWTERWLRDRTDDELVELLNQRSLSHRSPGYDKRRRERVELEIARRARVRAKAHQQAIGGVMGEEG
jgi:hypothetical protein